MRFNTAAATAASTTRTSTPVLRITIGILLLASSAFATPKLRAASRDEDIDLSSEEEVPKNHRKKLEDEIDLNLAFDSERMKDEQLPLLPPIILLDFVNGTDEDPSNTTDREDEKSKRTIDDNLGYGINRNNLFTGKHNYYFLGGKGGTAVSIEESFSPFQPQTVTEVIKPITEKNEGDTPPDKSKSHHAFFEGLPNPLPLMNNNRDNLPVYPPYPVFGQRTKLHKTSSADFGDNKVRAPVKYSSAYTTSSTPILDHHNKQVGSYASIKPAGYPTGSSSYSNSVNVNSYARPMNSPYLINYMTDGYGANNAQTSYDSKPSPTVSPGTVSQELNFAGHPKYTIENGIKYEHKIVWKYPDGKISETPPTSYFNAYNDYLERQKHQEANNNGNFRPSQPYPLHEQQQASPINGYSQHKNTAQSNIHSQKPIQFPNDQEQPNENEQKDQSKFSSMLSAGGSSGNYYDANPYSLAAHQGQYGMKYNPKPNSYRPAVSHSNQYSSFVNTQQPAKYPASSQEIQYTYHSEFQPSGHLFSANGQLNKQILSKYTPQAQKYLAKVFANGKNVMKHEYQTDAPGSYANTDYSSLLNYNPSISQYIKNPSSILKAQPTFVQAGNSLIPVIILRVDGAPPIQTKSSNSNINLKALLRQYLTQYAQSVSKVTQNTNYDLGSSVESERLSAASSNPVEDLKQLTAILASLRQRGYQDPDFTSHSNDYSRRQSDAAEKAYVTRFSEYTRDNQDANMGQESKKRMKVKSVQIIEDPRYTSYSINNN